MYVYIYIYIYIYVYPIALRAYPATVPGQRSWHIDHDGIIVLLGIHMHCLSKQESTERVRCSGRRPKVDIIIWSSYTLTCVHHAYTTGDASPWILLVICLMACVEAIAGKESMNVLCSCLLFCECQRPVGRNFFAFRDRSPITWSPFSCASSTVCLI